ncbi:D-glycero-beta-D-manno-heptose 1-phosphate adenylyltransferase [Sandaracinomonas limnophila]|uniref:D-glycero-beta-D-manno-heptose 1-phosphate adenylyltransferase n=1 Tax=Sandaracinomonas limnophila TaxID=1862386 RepID=A0A437PRG2_9BACT|nr:D-glycero-beta-D-manno-heptose 1-phosphate adenylyltransferase [Sandaracinomonas limnophila]RVU24820.1 D-glycero-beta-D-manno-heptose 1-phosphate adenylyltransferase [Sandaracinomonas limnophila]
MKNCSDKIVSLKEAQKIRADWKNKNEKVVFTNGCFDILHLGHVDYLEKAKNTGNRMIVGLNTDKSVKKLKGPERPINNEYARARLLAALAFVDAVVLFEEDTPLQLITQLQPDILVKGNDYSVETIVGAKEVIANGGQVKTIELVPDYSTTKILERLETRD